MKDFSDKPLGYHKPSYDTHLRLYRLTSSFANPTLEPRPKQKLYVVGFRYNQGQEGACVGASLAGKSSAEHRRHFKTLGHYDWQWIYDEAKKIDPWPGEDYEGTSTDAGLQVLKNEGATLQEDGVSKFQVAEYRWATNVEDLLDALCFIGPVVIGMDWWSNFDRPVKHPFPGQTLNHYFIGESSDLGYIRGGHAILINGYKRLTTGEEYVRFQNSWGTGYPLVWMPRKTLEKLLADGAEAAIVTQISSY
jgi:hypothetical protein